MEFNRRSFVGNSITASAAGLAAPAASPAAASSLSGFPVSNILDFGGKPDGTSLNTESIRAVIGKAAQAGGGVVYFPPGNYKTGTIEIRDNVTLYLEAGATLVGSIERKDYQYGCLVYAENASNIAIRGRGTIDGNGMEIFKAGGAVRGKEAEYQARIRAGQAWRPGRMVTFNKCRNVLLEDVTLRNPSGWTVHPIECDGLTVRGISIVAGIFEEDGPNTDGIDPDSCTNVRISDCFIQCGDDAIVLKCGRRASRHVCRDIVVTNCVLITTETALKIGSETYGEFRNITFSNCAVKDAGCGVGLWMRDGGLIDGWTVNNLSMTLTGGGQPVYLWSFPRSRLPEAGVPPDEEKAPGTVRNIMISNVVAEADGAVFITGMEEKHIEGVTLDNLRLLMRGGREKPMHANPPYPFRVWGHRHSPYDIYCRYVDDLKLRDVQLTWNQQEKPVWGSAIRCEHVRNLEIEGFVGRQARGSDAPAIAMRDTRRALIHNCWAPEGTGVFVQMDGDCSNVSLMNNDLHAASKMAAGQGGAGAEWFESGNRPPRA